MPLAAFPATSGVNRSLDNMYAIFHPTVALLGAEWIERPRGDLEFHDAGATGPNAGVLELWIVSGFPSPPRLVCAGSEVVQGACAAQGWRGQSKPGYRGNRQPAT